MSPVAASGVGGAGAAGTLSAGKLVTPLNLNADNTDILASITTRDVKALKRWDAERREKWCTDLSLLAGSPIGTYKRYTRVAELTRHSHDPLRLRSNGRRRGSRH